jgi:hypothetical protein
MFRGWMTRNSTANPESFAISPCPAPLPAAITVLPGIGRPGRRGRTAYGIYIWLPSQGVLFILIMHRSLMVSINYLDCHCCREKKVVDLEKLCNFVVVNVFICIFFRVEWLEEGTSKPEVAGFNPGNHDFCAQMISGKWICRGGFRYLPIVSLATVVTADVRDGRTIMVWCASLSEGSAPLGGHRRSLCSTRCSLPVFPTAASTATTAMLPSMSTC